MKKELCFIIILLLPGMSTHVFGQNLKLRTASDLLKSPSVTDAQLQQIKEVTEATLNEYASASKLIDPNKKQVTNESIKRFHKLFTASAKIQKDYMEFIPVELYPYKDYSLEVYNMMRTKGVQVVIESAVLKEVKIDGDFFSPMVVVRKKIYATLDNNGKVTTIGTGRIVEQKFYFDIYKQDLERANIGKIEPLKKTLPAEDYTRLINISIGLGSTAYSPTLSPYWEQNHSDATLDINGGLNFSIGAELMLNQFITPRKSKNRNLSATIGLRYSAYQMKTGLRNYTFEFDTIATTPATTTADEQSDTYRRLVGPVTADEKLNFGVLEVPLGLSYRILRKENSLAFLHLRLIPGFVLSTGGDLEGNGFYDGILYINDTSSENAGELSEMRIMRLQAVNPLSLDDPNGFAPYEVGNMPLTGTPEPEKSGTTFSVQLSPTYYLGFNNDNPGWGLIVGLDLNYHFSSFLNHTPATSVNQTAFHYADDYQGSLPSYFTDKISGFSYGLRLGVFQRLNIEP